MAAGETHGPSNLLIWIYLVVLALASILASIIFPAPMNTVAIFVLAIAKATLVLLYFMHLRVEKLYIHSLLFVPLILVAIMFLGLFPDIMRSMY